MASWLVRSTLDQTVRFEPRPGTLCCVLGRDTLLSQCLVNFNEFSFKITSASPCNFRKDDFVYT